MQSFKAYAVGCITLIIMGLVPGGQCKTDFTVEHCLSPSGSDSEMQWSPRGRLLIDQTARSGSLSIHDWSDDEMDQWTELAKGKNSFYRLRIKTGDDTYLMASVLTCQLNRGDERIILHSDSEGTLVGFDYYTTNPSCSEYGKLSKKGKKKGAISGLPKTLQKTMEVSMSFGDKGDSPYMPEYEVAPPKQAQQSFWGKYWWVILVAGFVLLQSMAAGAQG